MQNKNSGLIKDGKGIRVFPGDDEISVSENTPDSFDPASMLEDEDLEKPFVPASKRKSTLGVMPILEPPKRVKEMAHQAKEQIYEENHPSRNASQANPKTAEELSKSLPAPVVIVDMSEDVSLIGNLHGLSTLQAGDFIHVDLQLGTRAIVPIMGMLDKQLKLIKVEISVRGETKILEYKNKYKLKSIICKDFAELMTQCKLVFVRG